MKMNFPWQQNKKQETPVAAPTQAAPATAPVNAPVQHQLGQRRLDGALIAQSRMAGTRMPYFLDGDYVVKVVSTGMAERKFMYVGEFEIIESNNADRPAGAFACWMQKCDDPDIAYPTLLRFVVSAAGCNDPSEIPPEDLRNLINLSQDRNQNPLKDQVLALRVTTIMTKRGTAFSRHDFYAIKQPEA